MEEKRFINSANIAVSKDTLTKKVVVTIGGHKEKVIVRLTPDEANYLAAVMTRFSNSLKK